MSKLNVPPPPKPIKRGLLTSSAVLVQQESISIPNNMAVANSGFHDMNFKVSADLHKRFKMEATARGMSMKELLEACFQVYLERFPNS